MEIKIRYSSAFVLSVITIIFISIVAFLFTSFLMEMYNKIEAVETGFEELNREKPFTPETWAHKQIEKWYSERGISLGKIVDNYNKEHPINTPPWYFYNEYKDHYWNITIWFMPEELFLAECKVFDITGETYCKPSQQGIDLISKYN